MVNSLSVPPTEVSAFTKCPKNALLRALPDETLIKLLPFLDSVELSAGEYLYRSGERIDYLYFPETTAISEFRLLNDGRTLETALIGSEGTPGLSGFLSRSPAEHWTRPLIPGTALKIKVGVFRREFDQNAALSGILFAYLNRYIGQLSQSLVCHMYHLVEQRFCGWICVINRKLNTDLLFLTQERIAESLGLHRPTVSKIAAHLQRRQIIKYHRGDLQILDLKGLEKLQCDCYRKDMLAG